MNPYQLEARLLKALAHTSRLAILDILAQGESCVSHVTAILNERQPYVSQQLMVLRDAGLVVDRRAGTQVYYRLANANVSTLISSMRQLLATQGHPVPRVRIPPPPIPGCTCPSCAAAIKASTQPSP